MTALQLPDRTLLLDGSMGRELRIRGVPIPDTIWSANALIVAPDEVINVHLDNIAAGADIITTNTYGVIRSDLAKEDIEDRFGELNVLACELAQEARKRSGRPDVLIAGSLPPLRGSYRADLVGRFEEILPLYEEQSELLAPHVDLLLCETMSSAEEARAAATGACATGKPVWVAWTLHERKMGMLRSEESVADAYAAVADLPVSGFLANCCPPEHIEAVMAQLASLPGSVAGGYGNTFLPVPDDWTLDGSGETDGLLPLRDDLDADTYAAFALRWRDHGANVLGGCCGTSPAYIARIRALLDSTGA